METWLSGRKHLTANEAGSKSPRRFESVRLRNDLREHPEQMFVAERHGRDDGFEGRRQGKLEKFSDCRAGVESTLQNSSEAKNYA